MRKLYSVSVTSNNEIKKIKLDMDMLFNLIDSITENDSETIRTKTGTYEVDGVYIGNKDINMILSE